MPWEALTAIGTILSALIIGVTAVVSLSSGPCGRKSERSFISNISMKACSSTSWAEFASISGIFYEKSLSYAAGATR